MKRDTRQGEYNLLTESVRSQSTWNSSLCPLSSKGFLVPLFQEAAVCVNLRILRITSTAV